MPPPSPRSSSPRPRPLLLALSGPTSSGKTTLATALAALLPPPHTHILHADDYYKPDALIPPSTKGAYADWDCAASMDWAALERALRTALGEGQAGSANEGLLRGRTLVVVEGFLLFGRGVPPSLRALFDVRVLLRVRREEARARRAGRVGYVTAGGGFWRDPEGYFDNVAWPNWVEGHEGVLGDGGEGEGVGVVEGAKVWLSDAGWGVERCLEWVVGVLGGEVGRLEEEEGGG